MGIEMSVTEFKAKCLELIDKISRHEIDSIELTKRGKPVAVVNPPAQEIPKPKTLEEALADLKAWQEKMKGTLDWLDPDIDLTQPIVDIDDIEAYHGRFFPDDD